MDVATTTPLGQRDAAGMESQGVGGLMAALACWRRVRRFEARLEAVELPVDGLRAAARLKEGCGLTAILLPEATLVGCVVSLSLRDVASVGEDARIARERFGFLRMWSIHPMQIRPIVAAMGPSHAEVERAGRILLAAQAAGWGPIDDAGDLHDRASYRHCWTVLQRAHAAGMTLELALARAFF
jgi:hypothetical protein